MKIHNKLIKSKTVTEKTDLWDNFITTILTRTGLHRFRLWHYWLSHVSAVEQIYPSPNIFNRVKMKQQRWRESSGKVLEPVSLNPKPAMYFRPKNKFTIPRKIILSTNEK